jgi:hypothetical protein
MLFFNYHLVKIGLKLSHRIKRDVGHLALLFVGQEGVSEGFQFEVFVKEAGKVLKK